MKKLSQAVRPMSQIVPSGVQRIRDQADKVDTERNVVKTVGGHEIEYDALVVAVGLRLNYEKVFIIKKCNNRFTTNHVN